MDNKTIFKIAFVPIWILFLLFAFQFIFGLISKPNSTAVFVGVVLLSMLIALTLWIFKLLYFKK